MVSFREIYQSKVDGKDSLHRSKSDEKKEKVFPEINIDIIGLLGSDEKFKLPGFKTVGITDKVYLANRELVKNIFPPSKSINMKDKNRWKI